MSTNVFVRVTAYVALCLTSLSAVAWAQTANPYAPAGSEGYGYQPQTASPYSPPPTQGYASPSYGSPGAGASSYGPSSATGLGSSAAQAGSQSYGASNYGSQSAYSGARAYSPQSGGYSPPVNDAYVPPQSSAYGYGGGGNAYSPTPPSPGLTYSDPGMPVSGGEYGTPYSAPPQAYDNAYQANAPQGDDQKGYNQEEIIGAGHSFFGAVSKNLASAVEYAFKSQGRPNGYILGEDAGGAFVVGLRYGEGRLFTKDAGDHKVFWQGPSLGYDAGAEGSKTMILVYNLRDPSEIYNRFGGVQGSAYVIGGVSIQFQKYNDVTLGVIRSGVGLRLGANIGYLNYTRTPTWNPL